MSTGARNELLHVWSNVPWPWAAPYLAGYAAKGVRHGFRIGRPRNQFRGIAKGLAAIARDPGQRRPVSRRALSIDRRLRREGMVPLDESGSLVDSATVSA